MIAKIVDSINTCDEYYEFLDKEALDVYEANKFAVENSGYDYADIYMYNLYEPYAPVVEYNRMMKQENVRAMQLQEIYNSIFEKI